MENNLKILAIETSCDETAAAVVGEETIFGSQTKSGMTGRRPVVLSNIISSQVDLHAKTGGVVPEVASRAHMEAMVPVIAEALLNSNIEYRISKQIQNPKSENYHPFTPPKLGGEWGGMNYQQAIKILRNEIDYIAVTAGPGLIGSLLVGFNAAKAIAYALDKPIISINHIEGHIYSALSCHSCPVLCHSCEGRNPDGVNSGRNLDSGSPVRQAQGLSDNRRQASVRNDRTDFPILALTVSGGHTSLTLMEDHGIYKQIGATLDDAVGEAYDKVAKLLGLGYPGGPAIAKLAQQFRKNHRSTVNCKPSTVNQIVFPRPIIDDGTFNFSFSGLKTAVLVWVKKYLEANKLDSTEKISLEVKAEIAAAFEEAVKDVLIAKTLKAIEKYKPKAVIFAGGVSANEYLRENLRSQISRSSLSLRAHPSESKTDLKNNEIIFLSPMLGMFGDNAAMIGLAAYYHIKRGNVQNWDQIEVDSNLELT